MVNASTPAVRSAWAVSKGTAHRSAVSNPNQGQAPAGTHHDRRHAVCLDAELTARVIVAATWGWD